ncbi:MAG: lysophospholipid acyltransferase family protein [Thermoplasmatota archaeon]
MTWFFYLGWPIGYPFFRLTFRLWKIEGRERIPKGGKIYAVNHCSNAEGPILNLLHLKPVKFLGKSELFRYPHQKLVMKGLGTIPIKRGKSDKAALENAVKALKKGDYIGIFPEGTRGDGRTLNPPHTGVIRLALLADVPIIPVGISGAKRAWPKGRILPRFGRKVWVKIGYPWYVPKPPPGNEYSYEELKELANELMYERIGPLIDPSKNDTK